MTLGTIIPRRRFPLALLCLLTGMTLAALPAFGAVEEAPPIQVRVLPLTEVAGEEFTLGEVAELDGGDLPALRKLSRLSLGRSPRPGRVLRLNRSFLLSRLGRLAKHGQLELQVPAGAKVLRSAQVISGIEIGEKVLALAAELAGTVKGELTQRISTNPRDAILPTGEVAWEISPIGTYRTPGGTRTFRATARVNGVEVWRTMVRVSQKLFRQVVLARRPLRRNHVIGRGDVMLKRKMVAGIKEDRYLTRLEGVIGQRTKRPIGRNEWIHVGQMEKVEQVPEGGPVILEFRTARMRFRVPGVALVPGKMGEYIPVRNLQSGRIVYGVVQKNDIVRVN